MKSINMSQKQSLLRADRKTLNILIEGAIKKAQTEKGRRQLETANKAEALWQNAKTEGPIHPYLNKKKIPLSGPGLKMMKHLSLLAVISTGLPGVLN